MPCDTRLRSEPAYRGLYTFYCSIVTKIPNKFVGDTLLALQALIDPIIKPEDGFNGVETPAFIVRRDHKLPMTGA